MSTSLKANGNYSSLVTIEYAHTASADVYYPTPGQPDWKARLILEGSHGGGAVAPLSRLFSDGAFVDDTLKALSLTCFAEISTSIQQVVPAFGPVNESDAIARDAYGPTAVVSYSADFVTRLANQLMGIIPQDKLQETFALACFCLQALRPSDYFYRVRDLIFSSAGVLYVSDTGTVLISNPAMLPARVEKTHVAKVLIKMLASREGYEVASTDPLIKGSVIAVPDSGIIAKLSSDDPHVSVKFGADDTDPLVFDLNEVANDDGVPVDTIWYNFEISSHSDFTDASVTGDSIRCITETGLGVTEGETTPSALTIVKRTVAPIYSSDKFRSHGDNALRLSFAYGVRAWWATKEGTAAIRRSTATTTQEQIDSVPMDIYYGEALKNALGSLKKQKDLKSYLKGIPTRSYKTSLGEIFSVNTSAQIAEGVISRSADKGFDDYIASLKSILAPLVPGGYRTVYSFGASQGSFYKKLPCLDADTPAEWASTEMQVGNLGSGYAKVWPGCEPAARIVTTDGKGPSHQASVWDGTSLVYADSEEYHEAIRQDAEAAWKLAITDLTPSGITAKKGCNWLPLLLLAGGGVAVANASKDKEPGTAKQGSGSSAGNGASGTVTININN